MLEHRVQRLFILFCTKKAQTNDCLNLSWNYLIPFGGKKIIMNHNVGKKAKEVFYTSLYKAAKQMFASTLLEIRWSCFGGNKIIMNHNVGTQSAEVFVPPTGPANEQNQGRKSLFFLIRTKMSHKRYGSLYKIKQKL